MKKLLLATVLSLLPVTVAVADANIKWVIEATVTFKDGSTEQMMYYSQGHLVKFDSEDNCYMHTEGDPDFKAALQRLADYLKSDFGGGTINVECIEIDPVYPEPTEDEDNK